MSAWTPDVRDPGDDWNTYEFQWTPDYISWMYNGQEVRRVWSRDDPSIAFLR